MKINKKETELAHFLKNRNLVKAVLSMLTRRVNFLKGIHCFLRSALDSLPWGWNKVVCVILEIGVAGGYNLKRASNIFK